MNNVSLMVFYIFVLNFQKIMKNRMMIQHMKQSHIRKNGMKTL